MPARVKASDVFGEIELSELQEGVKLREKDLKKERTRCENRGLVEAVQEIDDRLKIIKGEGPLRPGLRSWLGIRDKDEDPAQKSLDEELEEVSEGGDIDPDYATWELTVEGVQELVSSILSSDFPAVAKIQRLNRLWAGEQEKEPRPRDGALQHIRSARFTLEEQVQDQAAAENGGG